MTVGVFTLTDPGLLAHQDGTIDPDGDALYAVLSLDGTVPLASDVDYADITAECADGDYDQIDVNLTVTGNTGTVKIDMPVTADWGAAVTIAARYFWILKGAFAAPVGTDPILGYMDLNDGGSGNVESINSDFKVSANAAGLYTVTKAP